MFPSRSCIALVLWLLVDHSSARLLLKTLEQDSGEKDDSVDFVATTRLGRGSFGEVFAAARFELRSSEEAYTFAAKIPRDADEVAHELRVMEAVKHCPHVIHSASANNRVGVCAPNGMAQGGCDSDAALETRTAIIMPALPTTLLAWLRSASEKEIEQCEKPLLAAAEEGTACMHAAGWVHLDLKADNMMLDTTTKGCPELYIVDFGLSRRFEDSTKSKSIMGLEEPGAVHMPMERFTLVAGESLAPATYMDSYSLDYLRACGFHPGGQSCLEMSDARKDWLNAVAADMALQAAVANAPKARKGFFDLFRR